MNLSDNQKEHDLYNDMFYTQANDIDMKLALEGTESNRMFVSLAEFMKFCKSKYDLYLDKAPPIPRFIQNKIPLEDLNV